MLSRSQDALSYLDMVKAHYVDSPTVYNEFLDIMKDFKAFKSVPLPSQSLVNISGLHYAGLMQVAWSIESRFYFPETGTSFKPSTHSCPRDTKLRLESRSAKQARNISLHRNQEILEWFLEHRRWLSVILTEGRLAQLFGTPFDLSAKYGGAFCSLRTQRRLSAVHYRVKASLAGEPGGSRLTDSFKRR